MDLLNDLLDIAKIEAGQIELYKRPFSLRTILNEAIIIMSVRAREKNLSLTLDVDSAPLNNVDGCDYIGDAARLRQILTNLLGNAVKFTEKGGITLRAEENPLPNGSAIVTFEIVDTGIGIAAEHLPQIFEKFAQADTSISRRYGGSGLGLAITRSLVEQMNGQISVASTLGEGSVFTVCLELPMTEHHHQRIQSGASAQDVPAGTTAFASSVQSGSLGHVLLVEDWQPNILVACLMLEMLGYTYDVVRSGGEAVSMVAKGVYDAVLMDIQLPGIDGFEATRRIRAMEAERGSAPLPIIAVTANAMLNDSERCLAAGMQHYISKPLDAERLGQALAAAVKAA
jgi:CheY-like chemotaxis protein